jgi:hypothetical protein
VRSNSPLKPIFLLQSSVIYEEQKSLQENHPFRTGAVKDDKRVLHKFQTTYQQLYKLALRA